MKVLATNHVFDILVRAMGAEGDLQTIEHHTLPPRKRAGWAGGDDRGPSSKPKDKADRNPAEGEEDAAASTASTSTTSATIADGGAAVGSAAGGESPSVVEQAVAVGAESDSTVELPAAVRTESTSLGGAGTLDDVNAGGGGAVVDAESRREDGDGVLVEGESRREGAANTQAEGRPVEIASKRGGEQAGKSEGGLKVGDGTVVMAKGKRATSDAGLDVEAKRAKTVDGGAIA